MRHRGRQALISKKLQRVAVGQHFLEQDKRFCGDLLQGECWTIGKRVVSCDEGMGCNCRQGNAVETRIQAQVLGQRKTDATLTHFAGKCLEIRDLPDDLYARKSLPQKT